MNTLLLYYKYLTQSIVNRGLCNTIYFVFCEIWYEIKFKINTKSIECNVLNTSYNHYQAASYVVLQAVFEKCFVEKKYLLDVGCGKGRVLKFALQKGFTKVVGIDIDPLVLKIAQSNLSKEIENNLCELKNEDILYSNFDTNCTTFFLFNPFNENIISKFIEKLLIHRKLIDEKIQVIYVNPLFAKSFIDKQFDVVFTFKTKNYVEAIVLIL